MALFTRALRGRDRQSRTLIGGIAALVVVIVAGLLLLGGVGLGGLGGFGGKTITAYFSQTVGIYPGSDLRVLGVKVGSVDSVRPEGQQVKVTLSLDGGISVPAGANAVVVAPSVVADRYVQLFPPYTGGPKIGDGAVIPIGRTATPVELNQLYDSINQLTNSLGPNGINSNGAFSDFLRVSANNLNGNGTAFGDSIRQFGQFAKTLANSKDNLFATLTNLQTFTTMLKTNDGQVRQAEQQLATVNGFLADDRQTLGTALNQLATALGDIQAFIRDNRARIKSNVDKLAGITQVLVDQRRSLAEVLDTVPLATDNVVNAYSFKGLVLGGRGNLNEISMPVDRNSTPVGSPVCAMAGTNSSPLAKLCAKNQLKVANLVPVPPSGLATLPPLPLPPVGQVYGSTQTGKTGAR
ncbi:MAG TPA: MCE family protein [Streptosporangiaceae bacterium]|nr:MCE family protein [Streptosporangiaceae bacterium]